MWRKTKSEGQSMKRTGLSERHTAYALIAPAVLVILAVALYPLIQTFYISLFDMRLNHPTRDARHFTYKVDVERYADLIFRGKSAFEGALSEELPTGVRSELDDAQDKLDQLHDQLMVNQDRVDQYEEVLDIIATYQPVRERSLRYFRISREEADTFIDLSRPLHEKVRSAVSRVEDPGRQLTAIDQISQDLPRSVVQPNFVGLGHYVRHFGNPRLWSALLNTVTFVGFAVFFELVFGILIALLINRNFFGRGGIRATVLIPWSIPAAVSALIWRYMYDGQYGIVSEGLASLGLIGDASAMLSTGTGAMISLIVADVWKTTPFMALIILGGLQTIDNTLYESARVDGAKRFQQFFRITLPLLKNTIMVAVIFRSLDTFKVFDLVYVLTAGGPANATETLSVYAYRLMFRQMNFGSGSAVAVVVFVCIAILSIIYVKALDSDMLTGRR